MEDSILEMKSITKEFPGVKALDQVTFSVARGEIHCLVGENGAGKSTLMKVLSGVHQYGSYSGEIFIDGVLQKYNGIRDSERAGIAIIYQELALIPELSVYENIFLGNEISNGLVIDTNQTIKEADEILKKVGLDVSPEAKIKTLGVGKQQLIEIAKALKKEVKILILDEPTAALDARGARDLVRRVVDWIRATGGDVVMVTHDEGLMEIGDARVAIRDHEAEVVA